MRSISLSTEKRFEAPTRRGGWQPAGMSRATGKPPSGLSLVEVLVVIAVISVLATILFVSFGKVRESVAMAGDAAKQRSIGQALHLYLQENNMRFPTISSPRPQLVLARYLGLVEDRVYTAIEEREMGYDLASTSLAMFVSPLDNRINPSPWNSYATNGFVGEGLPDPQVVYYHHEVPRPAEIIYLLPSVREDGDNSHSRFARSNQPWGHVENPTIYFSGNFTNALFIDGHVERLDLEQMREDSRPFVFPNR